MENLSFKSASNLIWGDTIQTLDNEDNVSISSLETLIWDDTLDTIENLQNVDETIENLENVPTNCAVHVIMREEDFTTTISDFDIDIEEFEEYDVDIVNIDGKTILSSASFDNIDRYQLKYDLIQKSVDCRHIPCQGRRKSSRVPSLPHIQLTNLFWYI